MACQGGAAGLGECFKVAVRPELVALVVAGGDRAQDRIKFGGIFGS
jgi:hypothetical protein